MQQMVIQMISTLNNESISDLPLIFCIHNFLKFRLNFKFTHSNSCSVSNFVVLSLELLSNVGNLFKFFTMYDPL